MEGKKINFCMKQDLKEKYIDRLIQLISDAKKATQLHGDITMSLAGNEYLPFKNPKEYAKWRTDVISLMDSIGQKSYKLHFLEVAKIKDVSPTLSMGVLLSLKENIEQGFIEDIQDEIQISTYADFLELAELHLKENKNFAAVAVSIALEDGMKKIAKKNDIKIKKTDDVGVISNKLLDKKVYSPLVQRKVQTWKKLRDHALHAEWDEFSDTDVKEMIDGVSNFLETYYG
jgi:mRNA-degrading endonuclease YafQ of YafQ-DinJ toxin-antitoxin module